MIALVRQFVRRLLDLVRAERRFRPWRRHVVDRRKADLRRAAGQKHRGRGDYRQGSVQASKRAHRYTLTAVHIRPPIFIHEATRLRRTPFFLVAPARCPVAAELRNAGPSKVYKDRQKSHPSFAGSAVICRNKDNAAGQVSRDGGVAGPESPFEMQRRAPERALRASPAPTISAQRGEFSPSQTPRKRSCGLHHRNR
jgi:hypothetical protein